jgi:DNA-binding NarL/FixJ family response regulator
MDRISVFLADWQVLFREGIHFTLSGEDDMDVIGEATDSADALRSIQSNPPAVAVLNTNHDSMGGIKATRHLLHDFPFISVLLIMDNDDEAHLFEVLKSGAGACLTKVADPVDVVDSIRAVAHGEKPIAEALWRPGIASRTLDEFEQFLLLSEQVDNLLARLTPGEMEILHNIANGASRDEVCKKMSIDDAQVRRSLGYVLNKLVTNDYVRQVIEAAQNGLLSMIFKARVAGQSPDEYITRHEFASFKDDIKERFRSVIGDKP